MNRRDQDIAMLIGARLRELRVAQGLSVNKLAKRIGCSHPNLVRAERGRNEPSLTTIARIADGLGVPVTSIVRVLDASPCGTCASPDCLVDGCPRRA